jgi:hypothetical protein
MLKSSDCDILKFLVEDLPSVKIMQDNNQLGLTASENVTKIVRLFPAVVDNRSLPCGLLGAPIKALLNSFSLAQPSPFNVPAFQ